MTKEEQKRLKEAEDEVLKSRAAQTKAQKESDGIRRERDSLKVENDQLNISLRDNMAYVDGLNKQLDNFAKDYSEIGVDLIKTREERELLKKTLQELVDYYGGDKYPRRNKDDKLQSLMQNAVSVLAGDDPPNARPSPVERKRALQEKKKARMEK